jgi:light-regulated signal transduction histidine kinase (bacteriophytochrome)
MNAVLSRDQEKEKKREIEEAKTKIKYLEEQVSAQVKLINAVEHELANSLLPASRGFKHLTDFLKENYSSILNEIILSSPQPLSIGGLNKIIEKNLEYSYEILNSISKVVICDPNQMDKQKQNFQNFVKSEFSSFDFDTISVKLEFSGDVNCDIYLDEKQFRIFLKNLFKNAKMHGFHKKHKGIILFNIQKNESDLTIEMFNDGNRFPEGFSSDYFFRPLKKYGETGNKGIGGFLMNLVVQNHGGVLTLTDCSNTKPDFNVCFTIKLPLKNIVNESIN